MKCDICKKASKIITKCVECGSMFCHNCGDSKMERCNICTQFELDSDEDSSSEE